MACLTPQSVWPYLLHATETVKATAYRACGHQVGYNMRLYLVLLVMAMCSYYYHLREASHVMSN